LVYLWWCELLLSICKTQKVQQYINAVLQQVEDEDAIEVIRAVLESYINALAMSYSIKDITLGEVIQKVIVEMGDPVDLAKKLVWLRDLFTVS
jgi:F0F1-type ATP synthase delta subunit